MNDPKPAEKPPDRENDLPHAAESEIASGWQRSSSLGKAGMIISMLSLGCCVATLIWIEQTGNANQSAEIMRDDAAAKIVNTVGDGLTFVAKVVLFVVGGLVGGTLSLVGIVLSLVDLVKGLNVVALIGIFAGLIGPALLAAMLYLNAG